jgi:transposase
MVLTRFDVRGLRESRILSLVAEGRPIAEIAATFGVSSSKIYAWRRQDRIDRGEVPGTTTTESAQLAAARRRITALEAELAATKRANELLRQVVPPKGGSRRPG